MSFEVALQRALRSSLFAGLVCALASCGSTSSQKMDLAPEMINTPPHRMSRSEYPFDASGRYVDAWAAEGATRYGRFINTDRTEDGRSDTPEPERRPLPPPPPLAATRPPSTSVVATRPPATARAASPNTRPPQPATAQQTGATTNSRSTQTSAAKPSTKTAATKTAATKTAATKTAATKAASTKTTAKKTAPKKKPTSHTVGRGDSLSSLSRRYGVSIQAIKKANNLKSDRIIDGRKLVIPRT
jgi:LysM repeat protein